MCSLTCCASCSITPNLGMMMVCKSVVVEACCCKAASSYWTKVLVGAVDQQQANAFVFESCRPYAVNLTFTVTCTAPSSASSLQISSFAASFLAAAHTAATVAASAMLPCFKMDSSCRAAPCWARVLLFWNALQPAYRCHDAETYAVHGKASLACCRCAGSQCIG